MKSKTVAEVRSFPKASPGALYLLATPIGNLEDITLRAVRILGEVDLIACEDTRQTQKLLNHFQIVKPTTSYQEHNEMVKAPELVMRMEEGARVALVADAGTPGISDPGYRLVQQCIRHNVPVIPIPGVSAAVASLVASGLPTHSFQFLGFAPAKQGQRLKFLERLSAFPSTMVFFEAPHRITETLADVLEVLGDRPVVLAREVTKVHEEFLRGPCSEVLENLRQRSKIQGEMTVLIGGAGEESQAAAGSQSVKERVQELMQAQEIDRMEALKAVARERHISKSQAYREYQS